LPADASVRAVASRSPQPDACFPSFIAYLRAAMPQLDDANATLGAEASLARAYLELMHMRMPDRLSFSIRVAPELTTLRFPAMALLTLVVARLRERLLHAPAAGGQAFDAALDRLARELAQHAANGKGHLQWIRASIGASVRLIPVEQVVYLRADEKYTLVVWEGGEALIRRTIRELADELDPSRFAQIHRSVIVNLHRVSQVQRGLNETAEVHLKERNDVLPVSRSFLHVFRQM
jgi:DNA-binding LytR/AlgR family response regulator